MGRKTIQKKTLRLSSQSNFVIIVYNFYYLFFIIKSVLSGVKSTHLINCRETLNDKRKSEVPNLNQYAKKKQKRGSVSRKEHS